MKNLVEYLINENISDDLEQSVKEFIVDINNDCKNRINIFIKTLTNSIENSLKDIEDSQSQKLSYKFDPDKVNDNKEQWNKVLNYIKNYK